MRQSASVVIATTLGLMVVAIAYTLPGRATAQVRGGSDVVTVLTDTIADADSRAGLAVVQIARELASQGSLRVLPIAGRGGQRNLDDLLGLRGIDMAVLDSDLPALHGLAKAARPVGRNVVAISRLFDRKVYLLARREIADITGLAGKKLGAFEGGGAATARTVFGLSRIDVQVVPLQASTRAGPEALANLDAVVLREGETDKAASLGLVVGSFRLLPVPLTPALKAAYEAATIGPDELAGRERVGGGQVETVRFATVLASYNWQRRHSRYSAVEKFAKAYLKSLSALRKSHPEAVWASGRLLAPVPGLAQHQFATPEKVLSAEQIAALRKDMRAPPARPPSTQPKPPPSAKPDEERLKVVAMARPPLAGERLPGGGLVVELLMQALATDAPDNRGGHQGPPPFNLSWSNAGSGDINAILADKKTDILLPWQTVACDRAGDLMLTSAIVCDTTHFSEPLMQVVVALFVLSQSPVHIDDTGSLRGKQLCVPEKQDLSNLNNDIRRLMAAEQVTFIRKPSTIACIAAVQRQQADGFIAPDLEGRQLLKQLGVRALFRMEERPLATVGLHALVPKANPRAAELIKRINEGMRKFRRDGAFAAVMRRHLTALLEAN